MQNAHFWFVDKKANPQFKNHICVFVFYSIFFTKTKDSAQLINTSLCHLIIKHQDNQGLVGFQKTTNDVVTSIMVIILNHFSKLKRKTIKSCKIFSAVFARFLMPGYVHVVCIPLWVKFFRHTMHGIRNKSELIPWD